MSRGQVTQIENRTLPLAEDNKPLLLERRSLFEQHAQTVLTLVVVGLLAWVALTTQKLDVKVEVMTSEMNYLKRSIDRPQKRVDDLTRRVEILEKKVAVE